jgi:NitT/TauT family transport system substrate-binding protein
MMQLHESVKEGEKRVPVAACQPVKSQQTTGGQALRGSQHFWPAAVFSLLVVLAGCNRTKDAPATAASHEPDSTKLDKLDHVTLQLNWHPEVEHGGFYAAKVHGIYEAAGLDVEILGGGPETPVIQQVATRRVDFGIVNADNILFGRVQEAPIVAVMAPLQTSPRCLIVHKESGARDFADLKNMTIAMSTTQAFSHYLRKKVPLDGVRVVPYSGNVSQFLQNPQLAQQGYVFSEPFVARKNGADVEVLMLSDLGFNPYTSVLFTTESTVAKKPDLVRRMVHASIEGWRRYLDSPAEANAEIHRQNSRMDLDILDFGAKEIAPLVLNEHTKQHGLGTMTLERWQTLVDQLVEIEQVKPGELDPANAFTNEFAKPEKQ